MSNDDETFTRVVKELDSRKIKPDADWVLDDLLLFALLVGAKKFAVGDSLCKAIIGQRRPTNELDIAFNDAMRSLSQGAVAIEGAFAFAKLVFCDLTGQLRIDKSVARTVYTDLTRRGRPNDLATFPRLLAYRAFDLLVHHGIEHELTSVDAIVDAIQERSENMSVGDWGRIALAMRPSVIAWIVGAGIAIATTGYSVGVYFATTNNADATDAAQYQGETRSLPAPGNVDLKQGQP